MTTQNKSTNKIINNITNMHEMSITRSLEDKKNVNVTKNEARASFLYIFLIPNPKQRLCLPRHHQLFMNPKP
jgi:hypothetical protein